MSAEKTKEYIEKLLESGSPEIIAIKGTWGSGKTHIWKETIRSALTADKTRLKKYAYISLFGISSLEQLKLTIFEEITNSDLIKSENSPQGFTKRIKQLTRRSKTIINNAKENLYTKGLTPLFNHLAFSSIRDTIICFDDLERKSKNLEITEIFGLADLLKEQRSCQIAFILNHKAFSSKEEEEIKKYREKIIDIEIEFSPTQEECISAAIPESRSYKKNLTEKLLILNTRNIRIIKKIDRFSEEIHKKTNHLHKEIREDILNKLALICICHFNYENKNIPNIEYLKSYTPYDIKSTNSHQELAWRDLLEKYSFHKQMDLDEELIKSVERGFFDSQKLDFYTKDAEEILNQKAAHDEMKNAWDIFHHSFDNNDNELIEAMYNAYKKNIKYTNLSNLNSTIRILRKLGQDEKPDDLIEEFITEHAPFGKNLLKNPETPKKLDSKLKERIEEAQEKSQPKLSLEEMLQKILDHNHEDKDIQILSQHSTREYQNLFKETHGELKNQYVKTCLSFGIKNAQEALRKIGLESPLNKLREENLRQRYEN